MWRRIGGDIVEKVKELNIEVEYKGKLLKKEMKNEVGISNAC